MNYISILSWYNMPKRENREKWHLERNKKNKKSNHSLFKDTRNKIPTLAFKLVYHSNPFFYVGISVLVFTIFWVSFNVLDQLLFFSPILFFYLPNDAIVGFTLTNISASLLAIVVPMNIYLIKNSKLKLDKSLISGSFLGVASSMCASCSSIGFLIISTFGGTGIVATSFLTNYQIPLRLISIGIMILSLYTVYRRITNRCSVAGKVFDNK